MADATQAKDVSQARREVTRLLGGGMPGNRVATDELLALLYDQLRAIAQQRLAGERPGHTLTATSLVHEAYLRLIGDDGVAWSNRGHFFTAAAEAMRRILIEHARARGRIKRGGDRKRAPINVVDLAIKHDAEEIVMLDDAICRLEQEDEQATRVVRLRFYAGLSNDETAKALGVSPSTVDRNWAYARAWLHRALKKGEA